jgi:hypothetical protein
MNAPQAASVAGLFHYEMLKRHSLRIVLGKPSVCRFLAGEHLEMVLVTDLIAGVDVNPNRHARSPVMPLVCALNKQLPAGQTRRRWGFVRRYTNIVG